MLCRGGGSINNNADEAEYEFVRVRKERQSMGDRLSHPSLESEEMKFYCWKVDAISVDSQADLLVDVAPNSSVHEFARTLHGVSAMLDVYDDDMSVMRRSSMCMSRAFSVSIDSQNDDRSAKINFC
jgi:hypothetical protein